MKDIERRREERTERLKNSRINSTPALPKYKQLEKKFEREQSEFNEIKLLRYKNSIKQKFLANNPIKIKEHEDQYQERMARKLSERSRIKT